MHACPPPLHSRSLVCSSHSPRSCAVALSCALAVVTVPPLPLTTQGSMPERWHPRMARSDPRMRITPRMWRKSSQWVVLGRALARVVADDVAMADVFRATCWERDDDEVVECAAPPPFLWTLSALVACLAWTCVHGCN